MSLSSALRDTLYGVTSCCFPNPTIQINKKTFKVIRLLGEGGYAFVYLVQDVPTGRLYALKKIRCPPGDQDAVADAMREVDMYRMFQHENIVKVLNTSITTEKDGTKTVYIFLPYYKRGNLQDSINANNLNKSHFPERDLLRFFRKICYAVRVLHTFRLPRVPMRNNDEDESPVPDTENQRMVPITFSHAMPPSKPYNYTNGYQRAKDSEEGTIVPYAHRDLKPGNVLIADDGQTPVLSDFGSIMRARISVKNRREALVQQDLAAEHSTMAYRSPELYDVQTGTELDEKVDIWSLGCLLYATAYGQSPFEANTQEVGGSMTLAVLNGQYKFPAEGDPYSDGLRELIKSMLVVNSRERADIQAVINEIDRLLELATV
ncbi:kinase-like domain-containing protein [Fennellomyces sp. T-0311]|nr:kinase-like domain-containing protein [Fennellomyces sp. T-0311]